MKPSAKWQKFYKWYCTAYCVLTVVLVLLMIVGGTAWEVHNAIIHAIALYLGAGMAVMAFVLHVNLLLWVVSLVVWFCRRESAKGWSILGYGILMTIADAVVGVAYAIVSGA